MKLKTMMTKFPLMSSSNHGKKTTVEHRETFGIIFYTIRFGHFHRYGQSTTTAVPGIVTIKMMCVPVILISFIMELHSLDITIEIDVLKGISNSMILILEKIIPELVVGQHPMPLWSIVMASIIQNHSTVGSNEIGRFHDDIVIYFI
jgi:hypothetical protein